MKRFTRGLTVGKFSPLHRGHEYLLNIARAECEELVVIAYNNPEFAGCERTTKSGWFERLYPDVIAIVLDDENLADVTRGRISFDRIPLETERAEVQRRFVAEVYSAVIGRPLHAIFTSEDYGPPFTAAMNDYFRTQTDLPPIIVHREVDRARVKIPVSATQVRSNIHDFRGLLAPEVYCDFVKCICFLGGESTGKTTLAELAAARAETVWAEEYGRTLYVEKNGRLEYDDLTLIAQRHVALEGQARLRANRFLFIDTSPLTTLFYSEAMFGKASDELKKLADRRYDYTFLCMPDIPFVQDSTRVDEAFRLRQHEWYLRQLRERGVEYTELGGNLDERLATLAASLAGLFA